MKRVWPARKNSVSSLQAGSQKPLQCDSIEVRLVHSVHFVHVDKDQKTARLQYKDSTRMLQDQKTALGHGRYRTSEGPEGLEDFRERKKQEMFFSFFQCRERDELSTKEKKRVLSRFSRCCELSPQLVSCLTSQDYMENVNEDNCELAELNANCEF